MAEAKKEAEVKPAVNPRNVKDNGEVVSSKAVPGRPAGSEKKAPARPVGAKTEILFQTPNGKLCKKIYETVRTKNASYRRLIAVQKNVKG